AAREALGPGAGRAAEAEREVAVGDEAGDDGAERLGRGRAQEAGLAVDDRLERPAGGDGDDGPAAGHRLDRDEAEVLVERGVDDAARGGKELETPCVARRALEGQ